MIEPSQQVLQGLLAATPDALLAVDEGGRIVFVNDRAGHLFGWTAAELVGAQIETLVPEAVATTHVGHRAGYVADPIARPMGSGLRLFARRKDSTTFPAEISLASVTDESGRRLVLAAVRDVTDRIELEDERRRQQLARQREQSHRLESLGELAGGVAHDFNNLLGVILNYVTLVTRRVDDPSALADLEEIRGAAERAAGLTRQLLTFASRDVSHPEALEVNGIVEAVGAMLARTLGEHIEQRLDLWPAPLLAMADRHQVEQILLNLMVNARDAMADGGALTIVTRPVPAGSDEGVDGDRIDDVVLRVTDSGSGMSPEVVARAFEPFFTTKAAGTGTGLGLATVYGIVQQSGGAVSIESVEGEGTTVTVTLCGALAPASDSGPSGAAELRKGDERVLLVEDEEALRIGTARVLRSRGYDVVTASDGLEALALIEDAMCAFDLVITDVAMPRMRGDELARRLALVRPSLPVICMSGYSSGDTPSIDHLLTKPVSEAELLGMIHEVLDG